MQGEFHCSANHGKGASNAGDFQKAPARMGWLQRHVHFAQKLIRLQCRSEIGDKKLCRGKHPAATLATQHKLRLQRQHHGRQFGGGIGMRQAPSQRATVPYRRIAHILQRLAQQRAGARHQWRALYLTLARQGTDMQRL
jgi:hypothetical protein